MNDYIQRDMEEKRRKENTLHGRDLVIIVNPLPEEVSLDNVLRKIEAIIPAPLTQEIDAIYVGDFDILKQRALQALYFQGTIYVSNVQPNEKELFDDLVHEISHAVETLAKEEIYADGTVKREFLKKRQKLFDILEINGYTVSWLQMINPQFNRDLDDFFYRDVGYDKLAHMINGIFISPYSVTSLREYWGKGFENYVFGDRSLLTEISPKLYDKIESVFAQAYEGTIL